MQRANPAVTWREWLIAPAYERAAQGDLSLPVVLQTLGYWLFWPSLLLALSSAWGYLRKG